MSPIQIVKILVIGALVGYLSFGADSSAEARALTQQEALAMASSLALDAHNNPNAGQLQPGMMLGMNGQEGQNELNLDQADSDDDDDDDDKSNLQLQNPLMASGTDVYQDRGKQAAAAMMITADQSYPKAATADLQTQASHHHHGHGAKGWLDMGAWTGKKGSFGWYDKHPVGKGK